MSLLARLLVALLPPFVLPVDEDAFLAEITAQWADLYGETA